MSARVPNRGLRRSSGYGSRRHDQNRNGLNGHTGEFHKGVKWSEIEVMNARAVPDFLFAVSSPRWRASLMHNSQVVENYLE
jgi:hypothetical protein